MITAKAPPRLARCLEILGEIESMSGRLILLGKTVDEVEAARAARERELQALISTMPEDLAPSPGMTRVGMEAARRSLIRERAVEILRAATGPVRNTTLAAALGMSSHGLCSLLIADTRFVKSFERVSDTSKMIWSLRAA